MKITSELKTKIDNGLTNEFGYSLTLTEKAISGAHGSTRPSGYNYLTRNDRCNSSAIIVSNVDRARKERIVNGQKLSWVHSPLKTFYHELVHAYQLDNYDYEDWIRNYKSGKKHKQNYLVNELIANTVAALIFEDFYNDMSGHHDNADYLNYYVKQSQYDLDYAALETAIDKYYNLVAEFIKKYNLI